MDLAKLNKQKETLTQKIGALLQEIDAVNESDKATLLVTLKKANEKLSLLETQIAAAEAEMAKPPAADLIATPKVVAPSLADLEALKKQLTQDIGSLLNKIGTGSEAEDKELLAQIESIGQDLTQIDAQILALDKKAETTGSDKLQSETTPPKQEEKPPQKPKITWGKTAEFVVCPQNDEWVKQEWFYKPAQIGQTEAGAFWVKIEGVAEPFEISEKQKNAYFKPAGELPNLTPILAENGKNCNSEYCINALEALLLHLKSTQEMYADKTGKYTAEREQLHDKIMELTFDNKPCVKQRNPIALIMGGLPGSGKSTFLKKTFADIDTQKVFWLDNDKIKEYLPEYKGFNANQVHGEASHIFNSIVQKMVDTVDAQNCRYDFIWDGTMSDQTKYDKIIPFLQNNGYDVFVAYIAISEELALTRVKERYVSNGRYVPMAVVKSSAQNAEKVYNNIKTLADGYVFVDGVSGTIKESGGMPLPTRWGKDSPTTTEKPQEPVGETVKDMLETPAKAPAKTQEKTISKKPYSLKLKGVDKKIPSEKSLLGEVLPIGKYEGNGIFVDIRPIEEIDQKTRITITRIDGNGSTKKLLADITTTKDKWWEVVAKQYDLHKESVVSKLYGTSEPDTDAEPIPEANTDASPKKSRAELVAELKEAKKLLNEINQQVADLDKAGTLDEATTLITEEAARKTNKMISELKKQIAAYDNSTAPPKRKTKKQAGKEKELPNITPKSKKKATTTKKSVAGVNGKKPAEKDNLITEAAKEVGGVLASLNNFVEGTPEENAKRELARVTARNINDDGKKPSLKYEKIKVEAEKSNNETTAEKELIIDYEKADVWLVPLGDISTVKALFQGRNTDYALDTYNSLMAHIEKGTFEIRAFDPILLWSHPETRQLIVVAGHSRLKVFEAALRKNMRNPSTDFKRIPARILDGKKVDVGLAAEIALISNSAKTPGSMSERIKFWRDKVRKAANNAEKIKLLKEEAKKTEFKNFDYIWPLANLTETGKTNTFLERFVDNENSDLAKDAQNIAYLVGKAMANKPELTQEDENEIFDYLKNEGMYEAEKINTVGEMLEVVRSAMNMPEYKDKKHIDLKRFVFKDENTLSESNASLNLKKATKELRNAANTIYTKAKLTATDLSKSKAEYSADNLVAETEALQKAIIKLRDALILYNAEKPMRKINKNGDAFLKITPQEKAQV